MTLSDATVAALARQGTNLIDPEVAVDVEPADSHDPAQLGDRAWLIWPLLDGGRRFGVYVYSVWTPARALAQMLDAFSEYGSESARNWAQPFPRCPGHPHPATIDVDDSPDATEVVLRCPTTGGVIARIQPET